MTTVSMAGFERVRNLRFINRFGEEVAHPRRCYRYWNRSGGVAPLDVKLGSVSFDDNAHSGLAVTVIALRAQGRGEGVPVAVMMA